MHEEWPKCHKLETFYGIFSFSENVITNKYSYFLGLKSLKIGVTSGKKGSSWQVC